MKIPIWKILEYYWSADTKYSLHSPYVFDFYNHILKNTGSDVQTEMIEKMRRRLEADRSMMSFVEMGAGSQSVSGDHRRVSEVARSSLSGRWQCQVLYNMIRYFRPLKILEIGTSLGISTAYLAAACDTGVVHTLEGNPASIVKADQVFRELDLSNVMVHEGNFDHILDDVLAGIGQVDFAFIDGNHRREATISYFQMILSHAHEDSVLVVDDIYWSQGMNDAWETIKSHPQVGFSIDLFRMGIVFLKKDIMPRRHFRYIDFRLKPWSIGLFG